MTENKDKKKSNQNKECRGESTAKVMIIFLLNALKMCSESMCKLPVFSGIVCILRICVLLKELDLLHFKYVEVIV